MKNILVLINVRWWNATAFYAINTARVLKKYGFNVFVGSKKNSPPYKKAKEYKLQVVELNFESFNPIKLIKNFLNLLKFLKREKIEIVNAHRSEDHTFSSLAKMFYNFEFILTRGDRRKIKTNIFSKFIYKSADIIIITGKCIYEQNKKFLAPFKNKIRIIYGSVDEENFKIKKTKIKTCKKYGIDFRKKIVGMAGRLDYVKDQFTFIKSCGKVFENYKNVFFVIAGKEEHIKINQLYKLAEEYKIEHRLKVIPFVKDIPDIINTFDIAVTCSVDSETICRVVLEYMYLGKPVIGTNVNVIPEIVKNNFNGIIVEPKKPQQLADAILSLLKSERKLKFMSKNSKVLYKKFYSEKIFYKKLEEIIL